MSSEGKRYALLAFGAAALTVCWYHGLIPGLAAGDLSQLNGSPLGRAWDSHCGGEPACVAAVGTAGRAFELCVFTLCAALLGGPALAGAVVLIALVSPLGYAFVFRPAGALDSVSVAAVDVAIAAALVAPAPLRARVGTTVAFVVAVCDPALALAALFGIAVAAALLRSAPVRWHELRLLAATSLAGLLVHLTLAGIASVTTILAEPVRAEIVGLRWLIAVTASIPLVAFVAFKPAPRAVLLAIWRKLGALRQGIVVALSASIVAATFLRDDSAVAYAIECAILLMMLEPLRRVVAARPSVAMISAAAAVLVLWNGAAIRRDPAALAALTPTVPAADRTTVAAALHGGIAPVDVTVVDGGDPGVRLRYGDATFFDFAAPGRVATVRYVTAPADATSGVVFAAGPAGLSRIDQQLRALDRVRALEHHVQYDFVARFGEGQINDATPQKTPSGRGVMQIAEATPYGPGQTITLLSGFTYTFRDIPVQRGDRLVFAAGKMFALGGDVRATARVTVAGHTVEVAALDVPRADDTGTIRWFDAQADLSTYAGSRIDVTFAASSPSGDATGNWASFYAPAIAGR